MTGSRFSKMLPALEKSKEGALKMLQTLKPESNAFSPTKALVDFSFSGIECVNQFLNQLTALGKELDSSLKNRSLVSESYWQTLAKSEVNQAKITETAESIRDILEAFHRSGGRLRKLL